jgi:hypothetical protein
MKRELTWLHKGQKIRREGKWENKKHKETPPLDNDFHNKWILDDREFVGNLNNKIDGRGRRGDGSVHVNTEINERKMEEMDQQTNLLGKLDCLRNPGNLYEFHWSPFFPTKAITNLTTNSFYLGDFTHLQDPHSRLVSCILQPQLLLLLLCPTGPVVMPIIFLWQEQSLFN